MKKLLSVLLTLTLLNVMTFSVGALDIAQRKDTGILAAAEQFAYMDLSSAPEEMHSTIIAARKALIASKSWVADGLVGYETDSNGNIVKYLPNFSDIFPTSWKIPTLDELQNTSSAEVSHTSTSYNSLSSPYDGWQLYFEETLILSVPVAGTNTPPFLIFDTYDFEDTSLERTITAVSSSAYCTTTDDVTYNLGYTNATTGESLGYNVSMPSGHSFLIDNLPFNQLVSVRASTNDSTATSWRMSVYVEAYY